MDTLAAIAKRQPDSLCGGRWYCSSTEQGSRTSVGAISTGSGRCAKGALEFQGQLVEGGIAIGRFQQREGEGKKTLKGGHSVHNKEVSETPLSDISYLHVIF